MKRYNQEFDLYYKEVFAPVSRHDIIIMVITLAAQNSWSILQLDVESLFLHGNLNKHVFVKRPLGYVKIGQVHELYKLKKGLYTNLSKPHELGIVVSKLIFSKMFFRNVVMSTHFL